VSVSSLSISRPVAVTLLTLGIALAGAVAFRLLPVAPLPEVEFPTIQVSAVLPGASPETMATSVATPLERQFGRIAGVTEMTSTNLLGSTSIVLQFDLNRDINGAARDVQAAINAARGFLPPTLPSNPTYRKVNPADAPIVILGLTSDTLGTPELYDAASSILQQKLSQVDGVGQVIVGGSSLPAVRVEVDPTALSKFGVGLEDLRNVLATTNANRPKGQLFDADQSWQLQTNDQLHRAAEYRPLIVAFRSGSPVVLSDVADVEDSMEDVRNAGLVNGKSAVLVIVFRQPGANIIETVDRIRAELPRLGEAIPRAINLSVVLDRTPVIRASLHDVERTLVIAAVLVVVVVFVFLRNLRATLIPAAAVPVSLIATFAVMYFAHFSLNNLSLMALTIATGFVVDDAIVVLENTSRHLESGMSAEAAALLGAREISFTVFSMSVSLVAVFLPILLMGGMLGRLFREFAITLSASILVSLVLSLTTTPMMCARLLRPSSGHHSRLYMASERAYEGVERLYEKTLTWALAHAPLMLALMIATVVLNVFLFVMVPKGFFPQQDTGRLVGSIQADQNTSFGAMREKLLEVDKVIGADPAVDGVLAFTGGGGGGASARNTGRIYVVLKPLEERRLSADQVIARLRTQLARLPGTPTYLQAVQDLRIGGTITAAQYAFSLQSEKLETLEEWAPRVEQRLRALPQLADVNSDQQLNGLQSFLEIYRATAARLGISTELIDDTLYDAFGQRQVSLIYTLLNQYHVVMEVAPRFQQRPASLRDIYVLPAPTAPVPLDAMVRAETSATTLAVNHRGQVPTVTLSFNLPARVSLGDAVRAIETTTNQIHLPTNIRRTFSGAAQAFQQSLSNEPMLIAAALAAVYVVLGILYESYVHPLTILSTLPAAGVGALLALLLTGTDLSVIALIGIILLIGIVKKNGIMMVDVALEAERTRNMSSRDAIHHACLLRFRPILMTTTAALLGALPLALGQGVGSEVRRPLGIAIVGGLLVSQMLTLYTTPVIYLYLDRLRFLKHRSARSAH
jgi:multidrug efflux pump